MIAFGTLVGRQDKYEEYARRGILRCREPSTEVIVETAASSVASGYNAIIDRARELEDLEALVLLHEDTEILDPDFCRHVRKRLDDPSIGLMGVVGAQNVTHLAYWIGDVKGFVAEPRGVVSGGTGVSDVDAIDGLIMILTPWAVQTVRFDSVTFDAFHGYDIDYCFNVRRHGRRVVTYDLGVYHHTKGTLGDLDAYLRASRAFRRKWLARAPASVRLAAWGYDGRLLWRHRFKRRVRALPAGVAGALRRAR